MQGREYVHRRPRLARRLGELHVFASLSHVLGGGGGGGGSRAGVGVVEGSSLGHVLLCHNVKKDSGMTQRV